MRGLRTVQLDPARSRNILHMLHRDTLHASALALHSIGNAVIIGGYSLDRAILSAYLVDVSSGLSADESFELWQYKPE